MATFMGEMMHCVMCGKMERSDPRRESQWRALTIDGQTFYACPAEFPPDDAGVAAFKAAYLKVMTKCIKLSNVSGKQ